MKTNLKKTFSNINKNNKFGHAYLIYDTNLTTIEKELKSIIKSYLIPSNVDFSNNPDIHIVESDKMQILKEQILELQKEIANKSQINDNIVYIINECDKLNDSATNSLLKTLEEPEENIYAFLITSNIEKVQKTIKSRCILIKVNDTILPIEELYEEEIIKNAVEIINILEKELLESQSDIYNILKNLDRETVIQIFQIINFYYKDCINLKNGKKIEFFENNVELLNVGVNENNSNILIKKILLINEETKKLYYNVNVNLFLDNLLIEFERCNNG